MVSLKTSSALIAGAVTFALVSSGAHSAVTDSAFAVTADHQLQAEATEQTPAQANQPQLTGSLQRQAFDEQVPTSAAPAVSINTPQQVISAETRIVTPPVEEVTAKNDEGSTKTSKKAQTNSNNSTAGTVTPSDGSVWDRMAQCESGGRWNINTGNGYYGGLQFSASTWKSSGGTKYAATADGATREQQIEIAQGLQSRAGWGQWGCSSKIGVR